IIVKKVIKVDIGFTPRELMFLQLLPRCNRVVGMLGFEMGNPDKKSCSLFFEWYPLGDIRDWRKREFVQRNNKPVPETYIWRFLIQMSQALAFIHKGLGTVIKPWRKIIHRDIKPDNILVVDNGTTYPSFRLSDFGVSKQMKRGDARESTAGTHVWQPPELPLINTPAADIWSVGAVVHFIALGRAPVDNIDEYRNRVLEKLNGDYPASYERAKSADRTQYWRVKVPRKVTSINVSPEKQYAERTKFDGGNVDPRSFNTQYSDRLNFWMHQCLTTNSRRRVTTDALLRDMVPDAEAIIHKMAGKAGLVDLD
ncbi:kinase-like protein, partial [Delitschia confertaspora ATCC 74209]